MAKARILFLATHPKEAASTRCRVLAYQSSLQQEGYETTFHPFFPSGALQAIYANGAWGVKARWLWQGARQRWGLLRSKGYDAVFIHREMFPLGLPVAVSLLNRQIPTGCPVIFDFDDAIFLPHRQNRGLIGRLEDPASVRRLILRSQQVIAGNAFLAEYARRLNRHVHCLPTAVDTERYFPRRQPRADEKLTIGWIGSFSTVKYLLALSPVFERLAKTHRFRLRVVGAGAPLRMPDVDLDQQAWDLTTEAEAFRSCDIGVYPLWDDPWSKGKCGYKALQFMASGVPVVASSIGMNTQIFQHRRNGLLASSPEEWLLSLTELLEDAEIRRRLAEAGLRTVETDYSLARLTPRFLAILEEALQPLTQRRTARCACSLQESRAL